MNDCKRSAKVGQASSLLAEVLFSRGRQSAIQMEAELKVGVARELFKTIVGTTWDPAADGTRFLIEQLPGIN